MGWKDKKGITKNNSMRMNQSTESSQLEQSQSFPIKQKRTQGSRQENQAYMTKNIVKLQPM